MELLFVIQVVASMDIIKTQIQFAKNAQEAM